MKVISAALCAMILSAPGFVFSQTNTKTHKGNKKTEEPLSEGMFQRAKVDSVLNVLAHTNDKAERADICFSVSRYFATHLKVDSALFYSEKIKQESQAINYETGMAKYHLARSMALYLRNIKEPEGFAKAIEIFSRHNEYFLAGFSYKMLAMLHLNANQIPEARQNFHAAISYLKRSDNLKVREQTYRELGRTFSKAFERDSAAYYLFAALELAEKLNDPMRIFMASADLGELYNVVNDLPNAIKYLEYSLSSRTPAISKILVRQPLSEYADALLKLGDFNKAWSVIREYEAICEKLGDAWGNTVLNSLKGRYYFHKKDYQQALQFLSTAYQGISSLDNSFEMKAVAYFLGRTEFELEQYDNAISHFSHALRLEHQLNIGQNVMDGSLYISRAYEKKGDKDSALEFLRTYDHVKDSLWTSAKEKTVIELTTRYESEKKEQQIKLLQSEKELASYQLRSKLDEIEKQKLQSAQKSQQLELLSQQNEINRLAASEKTLAFDNQQKEMAKKQNELTLLGKENELQATIAAKEAQRNRFAYAAVITVLAFCGYVLYRYTQNKRLSNRLAASLSELRQAQEQLIKIEKEKEAENIRVRISRDIHDEVGATLSGVALYSQIAREKMRQHQGEDAQVYLDHITTNSKEMVDKMSDIVWAINPDNDSFERIITKVQSYAFNLCAGKGIVLHTRIDDAIREHYPPMQVKRNLYLFMKEAINNAVKYSDGKNIHLSLVQEGDDIVAGIKDDGKGFDSTARQEGNGLNNMRARAVNIEGKLVIDSQPGKGTSVRLRFNFHPAGGRPAAV